MALITPKTDWKAGDGIKASDLNRIEGNYYGIIKGCFDVGGSQPPGRGFKSLLTSHS